MSNANHEQLTDLLADRAVQPLSEAEVRELERLLASTAETDETQFERAAAAIHLTEAMKPEALPEYLKQKVIADANQFFGIEEAPREAIPVASNVISFPTEKVKRSPWQWAGWYAAAACLLLALLGWWPRVKERWENRYIDYVIRPTDEVERMAQRTQNELARVKLLYESKNVKPTPWATTKYPGTEKVQGDVVWSSEKQEGYMRFVNLAANDPNQNVYQLWIFDANQDEKYPVDGGVFNVSQAGEIIVPIQAKLKVTKPTLFAVTIEKPGGVVVSKRDKLILTAKVG